MDRIIATRQVTYTAAKHEDGSASLMECHYAPGAGALIVGDGTESHPLAVRLTPAQMMASQLASALQNCVDALGQVAPQSLARSEARLLLERLAAITPRG